ncbi:uncharacterized protein PRCAT00001896001 [Priceomyces carsonii]|uniref:uncharacterized protein n=1 Tax=Priceomyces carsonii TaxID=28549 RepID=UPI002EDB3B8B|nr:unnamed protein product [Priceomyces carsonii]
MGVRLSLLAPSAPTVAISSYVDVIDNLKYIEVINNSRFLKTIKAIDISTGNLVVVKILIKPSDGLQTHSIHLQEVQELIAKESLLLCQLKSILPWHRIIETDRAGYLIRQLVKTNLYDRLSLRPFLEPIEKLFFVFQMLKIIESIHTHLHIHHGDLKLENFLVTSWNWLMLTDFAAYTKPTYIPEDNPNQFYFYFDTSDRRACYLAPERFYNSKKHTHPKQNINDNGAFSGKDQLTDSMDLFSLGCIIVELYSDGEPTFTLSQAFRYMKEQYKPDLSGIENKHIKDIVSRLLVKSPTSRPSATTVLEEYRNICFPGFFYDFLFEFMSELNNNDLFVVPENQTNVSSSDLRIEKIYNSYELIAKELNFSYDVLTSTDSEDITNQLSLNLPGIPSNYKLRPMSAFSGNEYLDEASLIILNYVFSMMKSLRRTSSKLKACELIVALSERISDECKLDRSLPYLTTLLEESTEQPLSNFPSNMTAAKINEIQDFSANVVSLALMSITTILSLCTYITPLNVLLFTEYLLPKLSRLTRSNFKEDQMTLIKITLASCVPSLAEIAKRFWMMSNTFKSDVLKSHNAKLKTYSIANADEDLYNTFSIPKEQLDLEFENLSLQLLTDPKPQVKISLVNSILPLCRYFGIDKTNDILLPHLITYLNGTSFELRLAFLSSMLQVGPFVGVLSFEQYLLPLLVQTLKDQEQFVVLKVLEVFCHFVDIKLINPKVEFNALDIYKELLTSSIRLLLHPNEWIRQSVLNLILAISSNLTDADRYCFLYPHIKGFLTYDITTIDWNSLYPCVSQPLARQVFETAITWSLNATNKSLFWRQKNLSAAYDLSTSKKKKIISYSKNMGKSVYLPKSNTDSTFSPLNENTSNVLLSPEDKRWIIKLKAVGLHDKDLWKVFVLRDYIFHVSRIPATNATEYESAFLEYSRNMNISPRNIFFETYFKSEPIAPISSSEGPKSSNSDEGSTSRRSYNSSLLTNFSKVKASLQTVQANVFGELETKHDSVHGSSNAHMHHDHSASNLNSTNRVFSINNSKVITANTQHNYKGENPYILKYLATVDLEPVLDSFPEFGPLIKDTKFSTKEDWSPKGVCVANINTNIESKDIDSLTCVAVGPTSEFFVTGSESGLVRVWDTFKLEKISSLRKPSTSINFQSAITSINFLKNRFVISVTTKSGMINLLKIDVTRSKNKRITKYSKPSLIRSHQMNIEEDGFFIHSELFEDSKQCMLLGITSTSKLIGFDLIKMEKKIELQNPLINGVVNTFIHDDKCSWILVGFSTGILCLWDCRFSCILKTWRVSQNKDNIEIKKLVLLPSEMKFDWLARTRKDLDYFAMIGGSNESCITIWEIPSFECRCVLNPNTVRSDTMSFSLQEVTTNSDLLSASDILSSLTAFSRDETIDYKMTKDLNITKIASKFYLASTTFDKRITLWNLEDPVASISINNGSSTQFVVKKGSNYNSIGQVTKEKGLERTSEDTIRGFMNLNITHEDVINGIEVISKPSNMIISVDRSGYINLYK